MRSLLIKLNANEDDEVNIIYEYCDEEEEQEEEEVEEDE